MNSKNNIIKVVCIFAGLCLTTVGIARAQEEMVDTLAHKERAAVANMPYKISGKVIDFATGKGFAGAQITTPDVKVSAMTDEEGNFEIGLPSLKVSLVVNAPGYARQIVPVRGRSEVKVSLYASDGTHGVYDDDLSLSAGETVVDGFSETHLTIVDDMVSLLNGQMRTVTSSGEAGSSATFYIRGLNSINMSAQPLFVVDGVEWQMQDAAASAIDGYYNNPLTLLAPSDIEKVQILKNGSAIWGAKGANGVVLIETKRAREMATKIDANISMGFSTPFKSMPMMDAGSYRRYATDIMRGMDKEEVELFQFIDDNPNTSYYAANHNNTDWLDEINKTAFMQNYGVSVSGGDDIALYRFSLGFGQNNGNIDGTSFNRLNIRFNSDIKFTEQFKILMDIAYAQIMRNVGYTGLDETRSPYYLAMIKSPLYAPYNFNRDGSMSERLSDVDELNVGNPLVLTGDNLANVDKYRFNLNMRPTYQINDRLLLSALFGFSWDKGKENLFLPDNGMADAPLYTDRGEIYATALNEVRDFMARESTLSLDANLSWQILQGWRNNFSVMVGGRFYSTNYHYTMGQGYNTGNDLITHLGATNQDLRSIIGLDYRDRNGAWYLQTNYNYLNKYFLDAGASLETSSRFGRHAGGLDIGGISWGIFPSVSGAWLISSENFMKGLDFVNYLKLRMAYTMSGNDNLPLFANRTYYTSELFSKYATGLVLGGIGNENLKWETTQRFNVGLDFSILNNRLMVNADYFHSKTTDLLNRKSLNDISGLKYYWANDGSLRNDGIELNVKVRAVDIRDFKFDFGATIGHYKNKVLSLANGNFTTEVAGGEILTSVGHPVGLFYGYQTDGVYSTAQEAHDANLYIKNTSGQLIPFEAGDMRFVNQNAGEDNVIDEKDKVILGDPNPDIYGNFNLNFKYKHFKLSALFTYSLGNDAYNALRASLESGKDLHNQTAAMAGRWMADGQQTNIPRAVYDDPMGNSRFSDRWIEDASYLKFKRLMLSYDIPFQTSFLQNISVWAAVNNVCTLTKYLGGDPEFSYGNSTLYQGVDAGYIPQSRSFQLGVNISL